MSSTTRTVELPFGKTTAKCTIEIPDTSEDPAAPAAVIDFTYEVVAWVVKIAAEMTATAPTSPQRSSISSSASSEEGSMIVSSTGQMIEIASIEAS